MAVDYSRLTAEYDRGRADDALDRDYWLRGLREVGGIRPAQRVLDLGAGTGRFSRLFSETNNVVALDLSMSHGVVVATSDMAHRSLGIMEEAFPSLLRIDCARFPSTDEVVRALEATRFRDVRVESRPYNRVLTSAQQIERVRRRYLSTFDLLPLDEFERGLRFLEVELPRRYGDRFEMDDAFTFLAATR